ncbi:unnamed protein product [Lactuca saligna]|uniref:Uncharacterized protein n=1 Tax=Lactuca saligna TaxID=75948 RepID=A0AA36E4U9_LACSI|nr:unnamed protein product [Lactuca saligna]
MHRLVETRDSVLAISVCQHLSEKLKSVFAMLNRIEGVSKDDALSKQGEKKLKRKNNLSLRELEAKEAEDRVLNVTLATQMSVIPPWTLERIQKEEIDDPSVYLLEPSVSFELINIIDSQLEFPLTPKAFLFRGFDHIEKAPLSDYNVNNKLFSFYPKHGQPHYKLWSLRKMVVVKVCSPFPTEHFINIKFRVFRGASRTEFDFTLADLPCVNLNNYISLFFILSKDEVK